VAASLSLMGACSHGTSKEGGRPNAVRSVGLPPSDKIPTGQREALADGKVTLEEYTGAFERFKACAKERGGEVFESSRNPTTGLILYGTNLDIGTASAPNLTVPVGQCFAETFSWIDRVFDLTDPAVLADADREEMANFETYARPCLIANGITPPVSIKLFSPEFNDLRDRFAKLAQANKCTN
jgi:hypothetical protein